MISVGFEGRDLESPGRIETALYADPEASVFAVIDPARWRGALPFLEDLGAPFCCLHMGDLDPEVRAVSPHIVELSEESEAFDRLVPEMWGDARGILLSARGGLRDVQAHLRAIAYAKMPDGEITLFRFYDPRALAVFASVATPEQAATIFGERIVRIVLEDSAFKPICYDAPHLAERHL